MIEAIKKLYNRDKLMFVVIVVMYILILSLGLTFETQLWRIIPLMVSLIVMLLQSKANRYAYILGAINCILYTAADFVVGVYAGATSNLLMSFPMQVITFIRWNKKAYKNSTIFKRLTKKQWVCVVGIFVLAWIAMYMIFSLLNSPYLILDNTSTLIGIFSTVLCMLSYVEYTAFQMTGLVIAFVLYITIIPSHPGQITYLVYNMYAMFCVVRGFLRMRELYNEQQALNK